ncbi:MAG: phosphoenolpyruvate hydrolase family protein [Caldilineaceae bacterium]
MGLYDGLFRANLEETGMGYDLEVAMIKRAARRISFTTPYAFTPDRRKDAPWPEPGPMWLWPTWA